MSDHIIDECRCLIDELEVSDEIKETLYKINIVASSENRRMKQSVKSIFVVSPSCKELSKIAKCYERIIMLNDVYPIHGVRTYLELAFPVDAKEIEYKSFYESSQLIAATQNYFSGVFLISFEQWENTNQLIKHSEYVNLCKYIEANKRHTSFVFHVTPQFRDSQNLRKELGKYLNLYSIEHSFPSIEQSIYFVNRKLLEAGIKLNEDAKMELATVIKAIIETNADYYQGYSTLEKVVMELQCELYSNIIMHKNETQKGVIVASNEDIKRIAHNIEILDVNKSFPRRMGF